VSVKTGSKLAKSNSELFLLRIHYRYVGRKNTIRGTILGTVTSCRDRERKVDGAN